jgi:hypothetical protein
VEGRDLRATYEEDLNRLKTAQRDAAIADLQNTRNQALSNLEAERNQNASMYNQQRSTANAQNRMAARNFQEYLASTGRANSGLSAQARMQNDNNLNTNINYLNAGEASALADINRRSTLANNAYNTGLAGANANIEANYIQNLLNERDKELNRQLQQRAADLNERQFQESVRQFNENMALQRQQLASRFNSGSGGGGSTRSYSRTNSNYNDLGFTDTNGQTSSGRDSIKNGQLYAVDNGKSITWYQKNANGKDTVVRSPYATVQSNKSTNNKTTTNKTTSNKTTTKKNSSIKNNSGKTLSYKSK